MKKILALLLVFVMLFSFTGCAVKEKIEGLLTEKLGQLTGQPEENETSKPKKEPAAKEESSNPPAEEETVIEPVPELDSYAFAADHPHEGKDLTVFDGIYLAEYPHGQDEETWVQITGYNDFILLEYFGCMDGSVYRFWAEEFWPNDGWYTDTDAEYVSGKSQTFSAMAQFESYSEMPMKRGICLMDGAVLLDEGANEAARYIRKDGFDGGHSTAEYMRSVLGEDVHLDFDYQYDSRNVLGNWATWNGAQAVNMQLNEDGTFKMFIKEIGKPIVCYTGVFGFGRNSGNLVISTERVGFNRYPFVADLEWYVDEYGSLYISDAGGFIFDGEFCLWPVEEDFFTVMTADTALNYLTEIVHADGSYTDQYGTSYNYYYSLPEFHDSDNQELEEINDLIYNTYFYLIDSEMTAMDTGESLAFDFVSWESDAYKGILFLHVFAYTYDWELHSTHYIDTDTMKPLTTAEMLAHIGMDESVFLDTVRARAEELFVMRFEDIPEEDRDDYGYYECLETTVSDEFVNLDLPVYIDHNGDICVYIKLCTTAGSGTVWLADYPFGFTDAGEGIG